MKNYIRIDFKNCNIDYDYTIVPTWSDAMEYIESVENDFLPINLEKSPAPEIKLSLITMSIDEYDRWFKKHIKP